MVPRNGVIIKTGIGKSAIAIRYDTINPSTAPKRIIPIIFQPIDIPLYFYMVKIINVKWIYYLKMQIY